MKLNRVERALVNSPVRAWLQRHYEAPLLLRLGGPTTGWRVLEIGCGQGIGTEIILEQFEAQEVRALDIDPAMVDLARLRLAEYGDERVRIDVGDAVEISAADQSFDAVFDFGIIHHVPDWQRAVREVARVLRNGGRFYFEEVTKHALDRWFYRTFLDHPKEDRFTGEEFVAECDRQGIAVTGNYVHRFFGDFVIGVGKRTNGESHG